MRYTADTITDDALDVLYARLDRYGRALDRAHALAEEWTGDQRPVTRAVAAVLLLEVIQTQGWEQTDPKPALRAVPAPRESA